MVARQIKASLQKERTKEIIRAGLALTISRNEHEGGLLVRVFTYNVLNVILVGLTCYRSTLASRSI